MDLPYISEACVLPVPDHEVGGLVAALVRVKPDTNEAAHGNINLGRIRQDLSAANLVSYKLPALLRILSNDEEVPQTATGKPRKKEALQRYFQISGYLPKDYAVDGVEPWGNHIDSNTSNRLFDW